MYALLRNEPEPSEHDVEEAFDGNLCRCTGYRPILEAAQSFAVPGGCCKSESNGVANGLAEGKTNGNSGCCMENGATGGCCKRLGDLETDPAKHFPAPDFKPYDPDTQLIFPPALQRFEFRPLAFGNKRKRWFRPVTLQQLLEIKSAYPAAKLI